MKLLLAGEWQHVVYELACSEALKRLGVEVRPFAWNSYYSGISGRLSKKYFFPSVTIKNLNRDLLHSTINFQPDVVLIWRGTHIQEQTLLSIRKHTKAMLISYNNDDPFGPQKQSGHALYHHFLWKYYRRNIPLYDLHFVYRHINLEEIRSAGAKYAYMLRSYYVPHLHHPILLSEQDKNKYNCDIVFVGHYENDGRIDYLRSLVEAGFNVKLFGSSRQWTSSVLGKMADYFGQVYEVTGQEYIKALCGADMALCFFSRLNRDTYTRRCFEIPACGTLLISERTGDMQGLYKEGKEAIYFSSPSELVERASRLKSDPQKIYEIANAGHQRVINDRHSVDERMKYLLNIVNEHLVDRDT